MPRIACTFLCALTVVQALLIQKPLRTDAVTGFIGSATCAWCHKAQAEKQSASSMARAAFSPQVHPLFDRFRNQEARTATVKFSFLWKDEQFQFVVSQGDDPRFYASICASCHNSSKNPPAGLCLAETPGGCVSCHMPRVPAMRAIVFTNHWIGVYPSADKLVPRQRTR